MRTSTILHAAVAKYLQARLRCAGLRKRSDHLSLVSFEKKSRMIRSLSTDSAAAISFLAAIPLCKFNTKAGQPPMSSKVEESHRKDWEMREESGWVSENYQRIIHRLCRF